MKLITNPKMNTNHIVLENYQPTAEDTKIMTQFVADAMNTHEAIGGVYYLDHHGQQHYIEIKNQGLYAFLLTIHSLGARVPLQISFDDSPAPPGMWSQFWGWPQWLLAITTFILQIDTSFKSYFEYVKRYPRKNIRHESGEHIPGEVR